MTRYFFEVMPLGVAYLFIVLVILGSCEAGFLIGRRYLRKHSEEGAASSIGPMVGALVGMLAFVLAFTFSMAANHHGVRKQDVLAEATHVATAYRRADFMDQARATEVKRLLREYVDIRLQAADPAGDWRQAVQRSVEIHELLWREVSAAAIANPDEITSLLVQSIDELIDTHERRLMDAVRARIPGGIWLGLTAIAVLAMGTMGVQVGLSGKRRLIAIVPIALAFSVLTALIMDLNRPQGGFITVSQQPLIDLQQALRHQGK